MAVPLRPLLVGLAELLADAGIAAWRPTGAYQAGETAIILGDTPPAPDRVVALRGYAVASTGTTDHTIGVQVRCRGLPGDTLDCDDLADAVAGLLDYAEPGELDGVPVSLIWRQSGPAPLGQDGNRRSERADNYHLRCNWKTDNLHP